MTTITMKQKEAPEMVIPQKIQQAASLYGVVSGLTTVGNVPNKKRLKTATKLLKRFVTLHVGSTGAKDLLSQNQVSVVRTLEYAKINPDLDEKDRKAFFRKLKEDLLASAELGLKNLSKEVGCDL